MTVGELYELLDRLPYACDDFKVRFTTRNRGKWIQPECWRVDDDGDLILTLWQDGDDHEGYTVDRLKGLLDYDWDDSDYDEPLFYDDANVYISDDDGGPFYSPEFARCDINWKRERVDVWMD